MLSENMEQEKNKTEGLKRLKLTDPERFLQRAHQIASLKHNLAQSVFQCHVKHVPPNRFPLESQVLLSITNTSKSKGNFLRDLLCRCAEAMTKAVDTKGASMAFWITKGKHNALAVNFQWVAVPLVTGAVKESRMSGKDMRDQISNMKPNQKTILSNDTKRQHFGKHTN